MNQAETYATYPSLRDRTVLITGGASGIGASLVEHFAAQGSRVAFLDVAADLGAGLVTSVCRTCGGEPLFLHCDLTDIDALRSAVAQVEDRLGGIRVLINNAASDDRHNFAEVTAEYWDQRMAVNLRHQFFAAQAVAGGMAASGGGSIVNMGSISWVIPATDLPVYTTAKSAIVGLTRTLAHTLGGSAIRVNCVMPGAIMTERQQRLWYTPEYVENIFSRQALKRQLLPEDVARLVLFLAADDSSAITNQSYVIDGGWI